ncbi:MAG: arginine--tRNA ligase [Candidatus Kapaibacterium sp.]
MMQIDYARPVFLSALEIIGISDPDILEFEIPNNPEHGDISTNIAMKLARELKKAPRKIAEDIIELLNYDKDLIENLSIAGAGFINLKYSKLFYANSLKIIDNKKDYIGKNNSGEGKKVNVEYVSVNPTGLLHLGHGRNACCGDTVANLYEWNGWNVTREYYFNNAGNQMNNLAKSIYARYMQILEDPGFSFPENGYHGEYVKEIAVDLIEKSADAYKSGSDEDMKQIRKFGEEWCFEKIKATLVRLNINQDIFYNEDSLYETGKIRALLEEFKENNLTYEKDGAIWLALSKLGLEQDRVVVKSTGEPTYRLPDIAYHREKLRRGYDLIVDIFGSDHIATIPDVLAGIKSLGYDPDKIKVLIHQFVTLTENGKQVKMSKRTGKSYTLDDLLDEVGADVVRFFLIMRGMSTHLEFDLGLAREQSEKNPVFYLQYAHARICSIFEKIKEAGQEADEETDFSLLKQDQEINLIKELLRFEDMIRAACDKSEPHILADYLKGLAQAFHIFYHNCRIMGESSELLTARLALAGVTRRVINNGLKILGVSAPEKM